MYRDNNRVGNMDYYEERRMRREINFWNLMRENAEIETLTEEQHDTLAQLANLRHRLHVNTENLFNIEAPGHEQLWHEYALINETLTACNLPTIDLPDYIEDFVTSFDYDIDDEGLSYSEWWKKYLEKFYDDMEEVNDKIEAYLRAIDEKNSTKYAPTGVARLYKYEKINMR